MPDSLLVSLRTAMNHTWCFDINTNVPPYPYTQLDVAVLVLFVMASTWLAVLTVLAFAKNQSRRLEWVDMWPLLGMNLGAFMHILATLVSNGLLVGVEFFDVLRKLHCSLWDFWIEFALGFNLWFCSLIFIATKQCISELSSSSPVRDNANAITAGVLSVFVGIIIALCMVAEFGSGTVFVPELDVCLTSAALKGLMIAYSVACLVYAVTLAIFASRFSSYDIRTVLYPLRTIAILGVVILGAMLVINITNVTVFSSGRLLSATLLIVLYLVTNTTFYREVFLDLLHNKSTLIIDNEIELEKVGIEPSSELHKISFLLADAMVVDHDSIDIPKRAFEQTNAMPLIAILKESKRVNCFQLTDEVDDDEEDQGDEEVAAGDEATGNRSVAITAGYDQSTLDNAAGDSEIELRTDNSGSEQYVVTHYIRIPCRRIGQLIKDLNRILSGSGGLYTKGALSPLFKTHFSPTDSPTNHTAPLPAGLLTTTIDADNYTNNVVFVNCLSIVLVTLANVYKPIEASPHA